MLSKNKMQNIYNRYKESEMSSILNAYSNPSQEKVQAFERCNRYVYSKRNSIARFFDSWANENFIVQVSKPKVVSYSKYVFTYGCEIIVSSIYNILIWGKIFIYITPYNKYMCKIVNDEVISVNYADEIFD